MRRKLVRHIMRSSAGRSYTTRKAIGNSKEKPIRSQALFQTSEEVKTSKQNLKTSETYEIERELTQAEYEALAKATDESISSYSNYSAY